VSQAGTIQAALRLGGNQLKSLSDTANLDAQVLLAHLLDSSRAWILAHPEFPLPKKFQYAYTNALDRLSTGEPLAYVLGYWEFYGRRFIVDSRVLIPRPETEVLIELGLRFIDRQDRPCGLLDVGTGSGCIAITFAIERPDVRVIAIDRSRGALTLAKENAYEHNVPGQIQFVQGDLLSPFLARADLVIANLPYIPSKRLEHLSVAGHEPGLALDGGVRGLDLIKTLIMQLPDRLAENGMALLEIDESHGYDVVAFAKELFPMADLTLEPDLAGLDRYVSINLRV
jgi:release factor glutamine methyltransferase